MGRTGVTSGGVLQQWYRGAVVAVPRSAASVCPQPSSLGTVRLCGIGVHKNYSSQVWGSCRGYDQSGGTEYSTPPRSDARSRSGRSRTGVVVDVAYDDFWWRFWDDGFGRD